MTRPRPPAIIRITPTVSRSMPSVVTSRANVMMAPTASSTMLAPIPTGLPSAAPPGGLRSPQRLLEADRLGRTRPVPEVGDPVVTRLLVEGDGLGLAQPRLEAQRGAAEVEAGLLQGGEQGPGHAPAPSPGGDEHPLDL